ncbi:MAG: EF-hand domain-containing protein [Chthonomonadales bacterium]
MKTHLRSYTFSAICLTALVSAASMAQGQGQSGNSADSSVSRLMSFDKNKDGKLNKAEITDPRLSALFNHIDAKKKGTLTKSEIAEFFKKQPTVRAMGGPGGGPGGPGGPGGGFGGPGGPGGQGGPGGPGGGPGGGPPRPGQVIPGFMAQSLNLSIAQQKQIEDLQKEVDTKLAKILTSAQKKQMSEFRGRGPGGPGGPGGPPPND